MKIMSQNIHTAVRVAILIAASTVCVGAYSTKLSAATVADTFAEQCYLAANSAQQNHEKMKDGVRNCTLALRKDPKAKKARAQIYLNRGVLNKNLQQPRQAMRDFYNSRRVGGETPALSINIGNVHYINGDFERAIEQYNKALDKNYPEVHKAFLNRGLAHEQMGQRQDAIQAYVAALEIDSSLHMANERLKALRGDQTLLSGTSHGLSVESDNEMSAITNAMFAAAR